MPFNYFEALKAIGGTMLDKNSVYTPEMLFLIRAVNRLTCMGGPNYNPGTTNILNEVFDREGALSCIEFLRSIEKVGRKQNANYEFFWDLFKECEEDLFQFRKKLLSMN